MFASHEYEKLGRLLNNLHLCTELKFALMDMNSNELYTMAYGSQFCKLINGSPEGHARCLRCDNDAISRVNSCDRPMCYRCHAGLIEVALPVKAAGETVGLIMFGQILDDTPLEQQWQDTARRCAWYGDTNALRRSFSLLRVVSQAQIQALCEIINACISEVRLDGLLASANTSDARRLQEYVSANYAEPLNVSRICAALSMSKTKLYSVCREETGRTVNELICEKRIDAAKALLLNTDDSVRQISETVGYPDFNYFTKIFRRATGKTPSEFRRA